ncbi:MAG TPA: hypothetical protein PJ991_11410 [Kiritimatiellia bacterium]|nr:hypothetical protein [Kiritimatiellia bacterium]
MRWRFPFLSVVMAVTAAILPSNAVADDAPPDRSFDLGFIASRHRDLNGDWRLKILGPLYEKAESSDGKSLKAVRPFYSTVDDPRNDRTLSDYLWPVGTTRTVHDENQWRWLFFYGFNHTTNDPGERYRTWILPLYFQGRDASGKTYRAVFPLGGTIKDFMGRDEFSFVLFPLYSTSAINDISTVNYLWPFISRTRSERDHIYRARVFPFYGVNRHEGKYRKRFVLWPIYSDVKYQYEKSKGGGHILFPVYGWLNIDTEKTLWIIPPFFRFTKGDERNVIYAPWPVYQRVTGKDYNKHYIWPIWGRKKVGTVDRHFYFWPFFWTDTDTGVDRVTDRFLAVPFFTHTVVRPAQPDETPKSERPALSRRHKFWPIYSYRREGLASRFRMLELWPFAEAPAIERNWAPFWSIFTRYADNDDVDREALWGIYRDHRRSDQFRYVSLFPIFDYKRDDSIDPPIRSWNILKGLFGYERKGDRKRYRLLYVIRFGAGKGE